MRIIKVVFVSLVSLSCCLAAIRGKVTDASGANPIAKAMVSLEGSGHRAITGQDGTFEIDINKPVAARFHSSQSIYQNSLSLRNGAITITCDNKTTISMQHTICAV